jgi:serine/threonine-protein kinase PknG
MLEVAVHEREYLAAVKHSHIVGIYDFVTHGDQGFIVMEYVNGKTLMTLRKEHGGPLPVAEAISYILEVLPAFEYLDQMGLVYCDMKPENVMVEEDSVKLIDMGAVRRVDDTAGDIYGSRGYTAPEAHDAPTPLSDLYSVGRALAVLVANFDFQGKYEKALPPAEECDVFREHEALYRFLQKATRAKADERFLSAADMAEQLVGVLRAVAAGSVDLGPADSAYFASDSERDLVSSSSAQKRKADGIPKLRVDSSDAAASLIVAAGAIGDPERRLRMFTRALAQYPTSAELKLRIVDELVTLAKFDEAEKKITEVQAAAPNDWRVAWYRGRALLNQGKLSETLDAFQNLASEFPGELAPAHALGVAFEAAGQVDRAMRYYDSVSRADSSFASAALRLANCLEQKGDPKAAIAAYRRVPSTSNRFPIAQMAVARLLIDSKKGMPSLDEVMEAASAVQSLEGLSEGLEAKALRAEVLVAGATCARKATSREKLFDVVFEERALRFAAEAEYRACARQVGDDEQRILYVDLANAVRPVTWT